MNKYEVIVNKLIKNGFTISTMESCTGGGVVNAITNIPGASEVLKFSAITYSNEYKIKMGISADTIDKYSVYSKEVAQEMSKKISEFTMSTFGIGVTGKINASDKTNPYGENDTIFYSIYSSLSNEYYTGELKAICGNRSENKELIINSIAEELLKIVS